MRRSVSGSGAVASISVSVVAVDIDGFREVNDRLRECVKVKEPGESKFEAKQAAVGADHCRRRAELGRAVEIAHRSISIAVGDHRRAHSRLRQRARRKDLVGAPEESDRGVGVPKLERRLARPDQREEILGRPRQDADVSVQRGCRRFAPGRAKWTPTPRRGRAG